MTTVSQSDILSAREYTRAARLLYIVRPFVSLGFAPPTRRSPGVTLSTSPLQCQSAVALIANHLVAVTAYTTVRRGNAGVHVWEGVCQWDADGCDFKARVAFVCQGVIQAKP